MNIPVELISVAMRMAQTNPDSIPAFVVYVTPKGYEVLPLGPTTWHHIKKACKELLDEKSKVSTEITGRQN